MIVVGDTSGFLIQTKDGTYAFAGDHFRDAYAADNSCSIFMVGNNGQAFRP